MKKINAYNVTDRSKEFMSKLADLCEEYKAEILIEWDENWPDAPYLEFVLNHTGRFSDPSSASTISYIDEFGVDFDDIRKISKFINGDDDED